MTSSASDSPGAGTEPPPEARESEAEAGVGLPFEIAVTKATHGKCIFLASRDDHKSSPFRYAPGDEVQRRRLAKCWSEDEKLTGSAVIAPEAIEEALGVAENRLIESSESGSESLELPAPEQRASFIDENIVAELAWNLEKSRPDFIVFDRKTAAIRREELVQTKGGHFEVLSGWQRMVTPGLNLDGAVFVPTDCNSKGEEALRKDVAEFVNKYVELPTHYVPVVVEYVMLTWVHDQFDELPYLAFHSPDRGRGKSRALETVGAICYRPLIVGGGSTAAACLRIVDRYGGTLVTDEFDMHSSTELGTELNRIFNQGFQRNRPIVKCDGEDNIPRAFRCFGPKVFAMRTSFGDDATRSRTIVVPMRQRIRKDIPLSLRRSKFAQEALSLRNRLLAYRFRNVGRVSINESLAEAGLEDRLNQIGLPLLSNAADEEARCDIVQALLDQEAAQRMPDWDEPRAVFEVLLHKFSSGDIVRPGRVAQMINEKRSEGLDPDETSPFGQTITAHRVGHILSKSLEMPTPSSRRDKDGARYCFTTETRDRLCRRFGISPSETSQTSERHQDDHSDAMAEAVTQPTTPVNNESDDYDVLHEVQQKYQCVQPLR